MFIHTPYGELAFSAFAWISMILYFYLICKLLRWRRNLDQFKSSYVISSAICSRFLCIHFCGVYYAPEKIQLFQRILGEHAILRAILDSKRDDLARSPLLWTHCDRFESSYCLTAFWIPLKQQKVFLLVLLPLYQ